LQSTLLQLREKLPPYTHPAHPTPLPAVMPSSLPPPCFAGLVTLIRKETKSLGQQKRCSGDREKEDLGKVGGGRKSGGRGGCVCVLDLRNLI